jgi:hypothetical protein
MLTAIDYAAQLARLAAQANAHRLIEVDGELLFLASLLNHETDPAVLARVADRIAELDTCKLELEAAQKSADDAAAELDAAAKAAAPPPDPKSTENQ